MDALSSFRDQPDTPRTPESGITHLDREPDPPTDDQEWWIENRAEVQARCDCAAAAGEDTEDLDQLLAELDEEINRAGMRGNAAPDRGRRHRSTRRRQDTPPLPRRKVEPRTVGKTYTAPDGKIFRPSLFLTLTCPSYGRVAGDGTPVDPDRYDYTAAARDALHFAALFDRFIQNLRRLTGYDLQYFAAIEPQRRLAPHVHMAIRGTVSRRELREVIAATYHQVWWPSTAAVRFDGDRLPAWDEAKATYLDPDTGEVLPTWDQALDAIGDQDQPLHAARFGTRFDAQGVLAGSRDANRCIGYLTKQLGDCHELGTGPQATHADRLAEALRWEPCSPACANWLRYGIQPKNARKGLRPGACKGKAHRREYLGYAGRRVLTSRKWSGKTQGAGQEVSPERPVLTVPEVYALADAVDRRYRALVLLACFGSLRWGELPEQAALTGQLQPVLAGPLSELPQQLLISRRQPSGLPRLVRCHICHQVSPPSRKLHR